jgi:hypothetical protein
VLWLLIAYGIAGLLLGLYGRAPVLIAASFAAVPVGVALSLAMGLSLGSALVLAFGCLSALEFAYFAGALVAPFLCRERGAGPLRPESLVGNRRRQVVHPSISRRRQAAAAVFRTAVPPSTAPP